MPSLVFCNPAVVCASELLVQGDFLLRLCLRASGVLRRRCCDKEMSGQLGVKRKGRQLQRDFSRQRVVKRKTCHYRNCQEKVSRGKVLRESGAKGKRCQECQVWTA